MRFSQYANIVFGYNASHILRSNHKTKFFALENQFYEEIILLKFSLFSTLFFSFLFFHSFFFFSFFSLSLFFFHSFFSSLFFLSSFFFLRQCAGGTALRIKLMSSCCLPPNKYLLCPTKMSSNSSSVLSDRTSVASSSSVKQS